MMECDRNRTDNRGCDHKDDNVQICCGFLHGTGMISFKHYEKMDIEKAALYLDNYKAVISALQITRNLIKNQLDPKREKKFKGSGKVCPTCKCKPVEKCFPIHLIERVLDQIGQSTQLGIIQ